jgi:hypothetical protein
LPLLFSRGSSKERMVAWSQLLDDDEELGELLERTFNRRAAAVAGVARRRRAIAMLSLKRAACGPQGKKMAVQAFSWADHVHRMTEAQFKRRYRLTWVSFNKLLGKVTADLDVVSVKQAKNGHQNTIVPNAVKLAIGLRYLAGGDPQDLYLIYCVSLSYVYKCVWAVVEAVNHGASRPGQAKTFRRGQARFLPHLARASLRYNLPGQAWARLCLPRQACQTTRASKGSPIRQLRRKENCGIHSWRRRSAKDELLLLDTMKIHESS